MAKLCPPTRRFARIMGWLQLSLGWLLIIVSISSLARFYHAGFSFQNGDVCHHFYEAKNVFGFDIEALSDRVEEVLEKMDCLLNKLEANKDQLTKSKISRLEFKRYLKDEVVEPLYDAYSTLRQIRLPKAGGNGSSKFVGPINNYIGEEIRKYITPKENKNGKANMFETKRIHNTIGHACVQTRKDLESYMDYDVGSYCKDDWNQAQKLMLHGCDPLPRRRCLTRASKLYLNPYKCRDFECLSSKNTNDESTKCTGCFEMDTEMLKWVNKSALSPVVFLISDILKVKPGEIRTGIDYSVGSGSFAARMKEENITIISTALNLGAPFSEVIALQGLLPLYITPNQRLPFFENTMDLIHTTRVLDGWIDLLLLDFMLFDWDRVLRPGGLLWIDKFFCDRKDLDDYMYMFLLE